MDLNDTEWRQVSGDVNPCKHGGVFAKLDGEAIQLFGLEPVRNLVGDKDAVEVGHTFWSSEGWYDKSDLGYGESAASVMSSVGEEPDEAAWCKLEPLHRAVMLFECGEGKEPGKGGFTDTVLEDCPVLDQQGESIRLGCLEEDDEFRQEILGVFEIFVMTHASAGCLSDQEPFLVVGRHAAAEWVREQVLESHAEGADEKELLTQWRSSLLSAPTTGLYTARGELWHTIKHDGAGPGYNPAYEAAEGVTEAFNDGGTMAEWIEENLDVEDDEEVIKHLVSTPLALDPTS